MLPVCDVVAAYKGIEKHGDGLDGIRSQFAYISFKWLRIIIGSRYRYTIDNEATSISIQRGPHYSYGFILTSTLSVKGGLTIRIYEIRDIKDVNRRGGLVICTVPIK